jgi:hypothetical protein
VVFRTYCSQCPVDGQHHVRPPILKPGRTHPGDIVGRYQAALDAGDAEAVVNTFAPYGYFREPIGPHYTHRGTAELEQDRLPNKGFAGAVFAIKAKRGEGAHV